MSVSMFYEEQEVQTYKKLLLHFGPDFQTLAKQMNTIFAYDKMTASTIRIRWQSQDDPQKNRDMIAPREAYEIYDLFLESIKNEDHHIWRHVSKKFAHRQMELLRDRFKTIVINLLRRLTYFYAPTDLHILYMYRVRYFTNMTFNLIFYFGLTEPTYFYKENAILVEIWQRSKKLWKLVDLFFRLRLLEKYDIKHYCDYLVFQRLPKVAEHDFSEMMEAIITLDTLNRLTLNQDPYYQKQSNYRGQRAQHHREFEPKKSYNEEEDLMLEERRVVKPLVRRSRLEIARQKAAEQRKSLNASFTVDQQGEPLIVPSSNTEYSAKRMKQVFPQFTPKQRHILECSDTAMKLMALHGTMDQQVIKPKTAQKRLKK